MSWLPSIRSLPISNYAMKTTDLIVIGSGPGGYRAAAYAAKNGLQVTVFEAAEAGGTCLNSGCIPTKTLCHEAEKMALLKDAGAVDLPTFSAIVARKDEVVAQLRQSVEGLMQMPGITFVRASAMFKDAHTVTADGEDYTAPHIIIATGSRAKMPPVEGMQHPKVLTSTELLGITELPHRLCIVGAGVIGMEFASVYSALGAEVCVVEFLKEALPAMDSDLAKRLRQSLSRRGVDFRMQSAVKCIVPVTGENGEEALQVCFERKGKEDCVCADLVLVATGRAANTDGLGLEHAGIETGKKGICTDADYQTSVPGVYAIGDVNGRSMLAHAATMQGLHVVNRILGRADSIDTGIMPAAVFTQPELAGVGLTEEQCKEMGMNCSCRKAFYRANGKALSMEAAEGLVKLLSDEQGRIVGCHALGVHASFLVQEAAALMNFGATVQQLADIVHIHPTLSEILQDAAF